MNIAKMMQQAKVMQEKMQEMQAELAEKEVEGNAGGGLVKTVMTCRGEVRGLTIDPSLINADEKDVLEDLIKAAVNDAKNKADQMMAEETQKMMSDMGLPAGAAAGGLPF